MRSPSLNRLFGIFGFLLLALFVGGAASAQGTANQPRNLGDLSIFRNIAADTLGIVDAGDLDRAKMRIKDLEAAWDRAEVKLRPRHPEQWQAVDKAIDVALAQLRADQPQASGAKDALHALLLILDPANPPKTAALGETNALATAKLSVTDVIAAAEKLQAGASVLDVSFEPQNGVPAYAVRTYANRKVWDGIIDATSGQAIGSGTVVEESALDAEDKAELAALKGAKITLREAIALAEKTNGGRALNAGLEQVRGKAVWEILVRTKKSAKQIHIDPISGKLSMADAPQ
ncbi:PepSY domain-containing protein [Bradyrhizobium genosp. A]|uniref:PepSY domain-containing protein n=1 Tax=Bradyrhizobium genosp. A TaxID=83626 RepID=UPI003CFAD17E